MPASWCSACRCNTRRTARIGRPTPGGAQRDGVDLVAVFLVGRAGIKGGETRVFEAAGTSGQRFTLTEPWSLLLLDDSRMIQKCPQIPRLTEAGHRDPLVVTCRRGNFQGADVVGAAPASQPGSAIRQAPPDPLPRPGFSARQDA